MGLYEQFSLLPPPPRNALSSYPDGVRAVLPDFTLDPHPADALRKWVRSLYYLDLDALWIHIFVGTGILAMLTVVIWCFIILPQMIRGSFWLVRLVRKPGGTLLVPNAMLGFTGSAGIFAGLMMAWFAMLRRWFARNQGSPDTMYLWLQLCWLPLCLAAMIAALGLFHARPNAFSSSVLSERTGIRRFIIRPVVLNTCAISLPILQATAVLIPAGITHGKYIKNLRAYEAWSVKYASQPELSQEMVLEAQRLWYGLFPVYYSASNAFLVWTCCALSVFLCYTFLLIRLMHVLRKQLNFLRHKQFRRDHPTLALRTFHIVQPPKDDEPVDEENCGSNEPVEFFPKVNKNSHIVRRQAPRDTATRNTQYRYLQTAFFHVSVQGLAISPAILMYTIIACWLGVALRSTVEAPDSAAWCSVLIKIICIATYTACFAGTVVLFSIAHRTAWEPLLHFRGFAMGEASSDGAMKRPRTRNGTTRNGPSRPSTAGRGVGTPATGGGDSGQGHVFTTYFESETINRPVAAVPSNSRAARRMSYQAVLDEQGNASAKEVNPLRLNRRASQTIIITEVSAEAERDSSCDTFMYNATSPSSGANLQPTAQGGFTQHNGSTSDVSDGKQSTNSNFTLGAGSTTSSNPPKSLLRPVSR